MAGVPASGMVGISVAIALQATAIAAQGVQAGQVGEPTMMPSWPHTEFGQREFPDRGRLHVAPRCAVPTRHRTSDPRPVVELLLGRAALPRALGCGTIQQVGGEAGHPISGFGVSARREIVAVNEHQVAVAKPHRPPARRVYDVMLTDIHPLAGAVAEILHDNTEAFAVGARIHPHRYPDGEPVVCRAAFRGPLVGVSHWQERPPWR